MILVGHPRRAPAALGGPDAAVGGRRPPARPGDRPGGLREVREAAHGAAQRDAAGRPHHAAPGGARRARSGSSRGETAHPYRSIRTTFRTACKRAGLDGRHAARAAAHLRVAARDGRRGSADDSGAGRLGLARHGAALHAPEPDAQGRGGRADCLEFPNGIHNTGRSRVSWCVVSPHRQRAPP